VQEAVHDLVYDVLIFKVKQRLEGVSSLPLWSAAEEENAFDLPSFSAYPLPYIRSVGEYLLTLPQQLEPLAVTQGEGEAEEGEESFLATEWVFQVRDGHCFGRQYWLVLEGLESVCFISAAAVASRGGKVEGGAEEGEESFLATEWVFQVRGEHCFGRQNMVAFGRFRERLRCFCSSWSL
jgi:hypothetical protein